MKNRHLGWLLALAVGGASPAWGIHLNVTSPFNATTFGFSGDPGSYGAGSTVQLLNSGGIIPDVFGGTVTGLVRYASISAADNGNGGNSQDQAIVNSDYNTAFSITGAPGKVAFSFRIDSRISGGLTVVDDYTLDNGTDGFVSIGNVGGRLDGVQYPGLGLATAAAQSGSASISETAINATNSITFGPYLTTGAPQIHIAQFFWTTEARSNTVSNTFDNGDEAAARFGLTMSIPGGGGSFEQFGGVVAQNYPGAIPRLIDLDGHFAAITAVIVNTAPVANSGGPYVFNGLNLQRILNGTGSLSGQTGNEPGQTATFDWKIGPTTIGTGPLATVSFADVGITIPGGTAAGTLTVTDNGAFNLSDSTGVSYAYENGVPNVLALLANQNFNGSVTVSSLFGDADLSGNDLLTGFENLIYEFDSAPAASVAEVGDSLWVGSTSPTQQTPGLLVRTLTKAQLLALFGGPGQHVLYANVRDRAGAVSSRAIEVTVVPEPSAWLLAVTAGLGLAGWRRRARRGRGR